MEGFRNVLVPLDFSELSVPTLDLAVRVLAPDGQATLLNVVEWLPVVTEGTFGVYPHRRDIDQLKQLSREKLQGYAAERAPAHLIPDVREGRPAAIILDLVATLHPDLVVIGSHGRSGLDHLLLGSVTERVLRRAQVPVLVVRGRRAD